VAILIRWKEDWFVGRIVNPPRDDCRLILLAADDVKYEAMGFHRRLDSPDPRYRRDFVHDPGFQYFPIIKYSGVVVALESINPDASPRELYIRWIDCYDEDNIPPDVANWEGGNGRADCGFCRHVVIDDRLFTGSDLGKWIYCQDLR